MSVQCSDTYVQFCQFLSRWPGSGFQMYEESVLAQGALIQVQQGLGKHMATKN
jgi:hypothetical protein